MRWSKYNYFFKSENFGFLLYNSLSNSFIDIHDDDVPIYTEFMNAEEIDIAKIYDNIVINELIDLKIIVNNDNDELINIKHSRRKIRFDNSSLILTINPTLSCNFACDYCFESNKKNGIMSDETCSNIVNFIKSFTQAKNVNITWFGGEPLIAPHVIDIITKLIKKETDLNLSADIITNGYLLTDDVINKFDNWNIRDIQITIDGLKDIHDKRRPLINGESTFDVIINNIDRLFKLSNNVNIAVRVNVDKINEDEFIKLFSFLCKRYPTHIGNRLFIQPGFVDNVPVCSSISNCTFSTEKKRKYILDLYDKYKIEALPFYPLNNFECSIRNVNSFVIGPEGELYKCWNDVGIKNNVIADINTLETKNEILHLHYLAEADPLESQECLDCLLFPVCTGGCPYSRIETKQQGLNYEKDCILQKNNFSAFLEKHYEILNSSKQYNEKNSSNII